MGLFDKFKKKAEPAPAFPLILEASAKGQAVEMADIPDAVFSSGALGPCRGVKPSEGAIYAPVDGTVSNLADTLHALGIETALGVEILIHVGVDTVAMNGDGFKAYVKNGEKIKKGQKLLEVDLAKVAAAGYSDVVITAVVNGDDFAAVEPTGETEMAPGVGMMVVRK